MNVVIRQKKNVIIESFCEVISAHKENHPSPKLEDVFNKIQNVHIMRMEVVNCVFNLWNRFKPRLVFI